MLGSLGLWLDLVLASQSSGVSSDCLDHRAVGMEWKRAWSGLGHSQPTQNSKFLSPHTMDQRSASKQEELDLIALTSP